MKTIHERYAQAKNKREKGVILNEFCKTYGCHRKHALRTLNGSAPGARRAARQPRQSPYSGKRLLGLLEAIWKASSYPCGPRLKATMLEWMPIARKELGITTQEERLLRAISPATIDRRLAPHKRESLRRIYGTTRPGHMLKHHIPIKTDCWDVDRPGFTEIDLVAHCGDCAISSIRSSCLESSSVNLNVYGPCVHRHQNPLGSSPAFCPPFIGCHCKARHSCPHLGRESNDLNGSRPKKQLYAPGNRTQISSTREERLNDSRLR